MVEAEADAAVPHPLHAQAHPSQPGGDGERTAVTAPVLLLANVVSGWQAIPLTWRSIEQTVSDSKSRFQRRNV
jgi:hypothetical protein